MQLRSGFRTVAPGVSHPPKRTPSQRRHPMLLVSVIAVTKSIPQSNADNQDSRNWYNGSMSAVIRATEVKTIISRTTLPVGDYAANPYTGCTHGCRYCYACFMKRFSGHTEPWGSFLDVKYWPEIKDPERYRGKEIFIGSVTDPYNPEEERYGRTRALLEALQGSGARISIATKSDLVLRDLDIISTFPEARVSWSVNTLDEDFRRDMDNAVSIERRLEAMRIFHRNGIRTTCFISPIFPGITKAEEIMEKAKDDCNLIWLENLNLRGGFQSDIMQYIREKHPDLLPLYEEIYNHGDRSYWESLDRELSEYAASAGLDYITNSDSISRPFDAPPAVVNYFYHEIIRKGGIRHA